MLKISKEMEKTGKKQKKNPARNRGIKEVEGLKEKTISSYVKSHLFGIILANE